MSFSFSFISLHLHNLCEHIHWWNTHSRKGLQANDISIWIVINVFMGATSLQFPPCTICVNTQIPQAVMATAFESVQCSHTFSISCTIMLAVNNIFFLISSKQFIKTPYTAINGFLNDCTFLLFGQYSQNKQITLSFEGIKIFKRMRAYSPWNQLKHQLYPCFYDSSVSSMGFLFINIDVLRCDN